MLVLHLSLTPLAGAPIRICQALRLTGIQARCAVLNDEVGDYAKRTFEHDLVWSRDREEIIDIAGRCDVLHLHNFIGLDSREFAPLDFRMLWEQGKPMVRHFHSALGWIARHTGQSEAAILECPIPKLVVAQQQERFFASARLVPNIVFPQVPLGSTGDALPGTIRIGYAPSIFNSARSSRWDTKGYRETIRALKRFSRSALARGTRVEIDVIEQVPHRECLARKARCHIVIDDLVTGSYHLNTLESLAQGSACITFMDRRTLQVVSDLTGRNDFPAINVGLEDVHEVLLDLAMKPEVILDIGQGSRDWMARHWAPVAMARHFLEAYATVQRTPHVPFPARFEPTATARWLGIELHDLLWHNRAGRWPAIMPGWIRAIKGVGGNALRAAGLRR